MSLPHFICEQIELLDNKIKLCVFCFSGKSRYVAYANIARFCGHTKLKDILFNKDDDYFEM